MRILKKIIIVIIALFVLTHFLRYNVKNDNSNIVKIQYINYLGNYEVKEYMQKNEIYRITQKLQNATFYRIPDFIFQESPTSAIYIYYDDSTKKVFKFDGAFVRIKDEQSTKCYLVNPTSIKNVFR